MNGDQILFAHKYISKTIQKLIELEYQIVSKEELTDLLYELDSY